MINILIVDGQKENRTALAELVGNADDLALVGEESCASDAVPTTKRLQPDVVTMDLSSAGADGLQATAKLVVDNPHVHVLVLTSHADPELIVDSLAVGAAGYLIGESGPEVVAAAVRQLVCCDRPPDPLVARVLLVRCRMAPSDVRLTGREWQVLVMLRDGQSNKAIAQRLGITVRTVKAHLTSVYHQLGVTDRTQAALWALGHGRCCPHALG